MKKRIMEKEDGFNGIIISLWFLVIIIFAILFYFLIFNANKYVVSSIIDNGLYSIESSVLATPIDTTNSFDSDIHKLTIISKATYSNSKNNEETIQVNDIGKKIQNEFIKTFELINNTKPNSGMLKNMAPKDSLGNVSGDVLIKKVTIYEPIYEKTINIETNTNAKPAPSGNYVPNKWEFVTNYNITGWVKYDLFFENNIYINYEKSKYMPTSNIKGATIEMTAGLYIKGYNNIFASSNSKEIFNKDVDVTAPYYAQETKQMDIVPSQIYE